MDLSHLTQLPPAFMNETQKTVGLKAWMTCLSVEQVKKHLVKFRFHRSNRYGVRLL